LHTFFHVAGVIFQLSDLLIEVWVESIGLDSRAISFHLVFVEIYEDSRDIFKKLVDPAEVKQ
jgi:hypothetical protein